MAILGPRRQAGRGLLGHGRPVPVKLLYHLRFQEQKGRPRGVGHLCRLSQRPSFSADAKLHHKTVYTGANIINYLRNWVL